MFPAAIVQHQVGPDQRAARLEQPAVVAGPPDRQAGMVPAWISAAVPKAVLSRLGGYRGCRKITVAATQATAITARVMKSQPLSIRRHNIADVALRMGLSSGCCGQNTVDLGASVQYKWCGHAPPRCPPFATLRLIGRSPLVDSLRTAMKKHIIAVFVASLVLHRAVSLAQQPRSSADWPQWRGPTRDGIAPPVPNFSTPGLKKVPE